MPDIMSLLETCTIVGAAAVVIVLAGGAAAYGRIWFYRHYRYDFDSYVRKHQRQMDRQARDWRREHAKAREKALQS